MTQEADGVWHTTPAEDAAVDQLRAEIRDWLDLEGIPNAIAHQIIFQLVAMIARHMPPELEDVKLNLIAWWETTKP